MAKLLYLIAKKYTDWEHAHFLRCMCPRVDDPPVESVSHVLPVVLDQSLQRVQLIRIMAVLGHFIEKLGVVKAEEGLGKLLSKGRLQAKKKYKLNYVFTIELLYT